MGCPMSKTYQSHPRAEKNYQRQVIVKRVIRSIGKIVIVLLTSILWFWLAREDLNLRTTLIRRGP